MSLKSDSFIFFETNRGDVIKTIAEILKNTLAGQCFCTVGASGIKFCNQDSLHSVTANTFLSADRFFKYVFRGKEEYTFGLHTQNFYRMIKASKKKTMMHCSIEKSDDKLMHLNVNGVDTHLQIQRNQPILPKIPDDYEEIPCIGPSQDYHTMCKEMSLANSKYIKVSQLATGVIRFEIDNKTYGKTFDFGSRIGTYRDKKWPPFTQTFTLKTFTRLQKIASISNIIRLRWQKHLPLCIGFEIEPLGHGEMYIESDELIQAKSVSTKAQEPDDDDDNSDFDDM